MSNYSCGFTSPQELKTSGGIVRRLTMNKVDGVFFCPYCQKPFLRHCAFSGHIRFCKKNPDNIQKGLIIDSELDPATDSYSGSRGEQIITKWLVDNNFSFVREKTYPDLIYKNNLRYDFYIESENILIEFNGQQHYKNIKYFFKGKKDFYIYRERYRLKREYAKQHGIKLIEIPYYRLNSIGDILDKKLLNLRRPK